jgi:phosphatidylserine/phosphatidylglycerophosphate/cardiolipin synthase-like enzyme
MLTYISNSDHYNEVLSHVMRVKQSLWIGTADIKDLYVEDGKQAVPFLGVLAKLIKKGVAVRLIHAKEPGPVFREDFDKYPALYEGLERVLCPRVHFKMMVFDGKEAYIGSANLTGAGIGMKAEGTRNFEAGILTDDPEIVEQAMNGRSSERHPSLLEDARVVTDEDEVNQFDEVWMGKHCKTCKRRNFCPDPIIGK